MKSDIHKAVTSPMLSQLAQLDRSSPPFTYFISELDTNKFYE